MITDWQKSHQDVKIIGLDELNVEPTKQISELQLPKPSTNDGNRNRQAVQGERYRPLEDHGNRNRQAAAVPQHTVVNVPRPGPSDHATSMARAVPLRVNETSFSFSHATSKPRDIPIKMQTLSENKKLYIAGPDIAVMGTHPEMGSYLHQYKPQNSRPPSPSLSKHQLSPISTENTLAETGESYNLVCEFTNAFSL